MIVINGRNRDGRDAARQHGIEIVRRQDVAGCLDGNAGRINRPAPRDSSRLPESHVLQMALYAEVLRPLYPGLPVRAALLYTETGRLIEVGEDVMAATLARLGKA